VPVSRFSKYAATFVSSILLLSTIATAQLKIGSMNTAFADPPVPHPSTKPCVVELYKGIKFADFNPKPFTYTPPAACPGPWAAVILKANFSVSAGIQFDRTANIWIGPTNIYFGTTSEPQPGVARHWQIERDLTDYSSLFTVTQDGTVDLGNVVNQTYTGVLQGAASLLFYPVPAKGTAPSTADQVIAFSGGPSGGTVTLNTGADLLSETLTLPTNIRNVFMDVFAQSQFNDEFWYTCVPDDVSGELESCPGTAFRESEITIDGSPAGVAPVYPWIYTGGIDPYLWIPIPGVQTLNFKAYRVNLTPFASTLDDGQPHTIAVSVFNANGYFSATASLLLYLDKNATQLTGGLTENTLSVPVPVITEHVGTAKNGNVQGAVDVKSSHDFQISGYLNTASGPVTTTVAQNIQFASVQYFKVFATEYEQDIKQTTTIQSVVTTQNSNGKTVNTVNHSWPLDMNITVLAFPDGTETQTTTSNQYFATDQQARHNGQSTTFSLLHNRVITTDTLNFDAAGNFTGNSGQASSQNYLGSNSTGYCYSQDLTAAANALTSFTNGVGCN
jgi:Peptide N-acetyl-beta-D-glucosaminyl asparaginase amidase A